MTNGTEWLLLGGIATAIMSMWSYVRIVWSHISSRVIVTIEIRGTPANAILAYLQVAAVESRFSSKMYSGWVEYVRPIGRAALVVGELLGREPRLFWVGKRPIVVRRCSVCMGNNNDEPAVQNLPVSVSFLRGTFCADQFVAQAVDFYNQRESTESSSAKYARHRIEFISGTGDRRPNNSDNSYPYARPQVDRENKLAHRLLRWSYEDLGHMQFDGKSIDRLSLSADSERIVDEIRKWKDSRDWHTSHGIPWKRGFALTGPPGTGKTSLVRAIGEDLDMPVFVYDLATLSNSLLRESWQTMQQWTPCIALFEDIDAVFHDRENEKGDLTFDCLINTLDGAARSDGVLSFVTTNRPEMLNAALLRPGRVDRVIVMAALDVIGKRKMASRILGEWPEEAEKLVAETGEISGAEFERLCIENAMTLFWKP